MAGLFKVSFKWASILKSLLKLKADPLLLTVVISEAIVLKSTLLARYSAIIFMSALYGSPLHIILPLFTVNYFFKIV